MSAVHYVLAGGGTGGHLFPGLAVADALRQTQPEAGITFLTTTRPLDRELLSRTPFEQVEQSVRPSTFQPSRLPAFWWHWRKSIRAARALLKERRPRAVLGLGGYAAGPPVVAAHSLGIRTAILNPDAIPGRANRYLAKRANLVVLQWEQSQRHFPPDTDCRAFGCPIRKEFVTAERAEGCRRFELDPDWPTVLVTGASQGARTVNRATCHVWPEFVAKHADWQLLHLSGPRDEQEARAAYAAAGVPAHVLPFTHDMPLALAAADVVVSRAGASTLAELTALGKPSILLPYPYHRDRHQHANAQVLVDAGAAVVLEDQLDSAANAGPLLEALSRLADTGVREPMAQAARELARPNAADDVAKWLTG